MIETADTEAQTDHTGEIEVPREPQKEEIKVEEKPDIIAEVSKLVEAEVEVVEVVKEVEVVKVVEKVEEAVVPLRTFVDASN